MQNSRYEKHRGLEPHRNPAAYKSPAVNWRNVEIVPLEPFRSLTPSNCLLLTTYLRVMVGRTRAFKSVSKFLRWWEKEYGYSDGSANHMWLQIRPIAKAMQKSGRKVDYIAVDVYDLYERSEMLVKQERERRASGEIRVVGRQPLFDGVN